MMESGDGADNIDNTNNDELRKMLMPLCAAKKAPVPSASALLSKIARLKSQEKYLESNLAKLLPEQYVDINTVRNRSDQEAIRKTVHEINYQKQSSENELKKFRERQDKSIVSMYQSIKQIELDIRDYKHLSKHGLDTLRDRIIGAKDQLERLTTQTESEVSRLQVQCKQYEKDLEAHFKK